MFFAWLSLAGDPYGTQAAKPMAIQASHSLWGDGDLLPAEGADKVAYCLFSFSSLAEYERFRQEAAVDPYCVRLVEGASSTGMRAYIQPPILSGSRESKLSND